MTRVLDHATVDQSETGYSRVSIDASKVFRQCFTSTLSEQSSPPTPRASIRGDIAARATSVSQIASRTRVRTRRTTACTRISRAMTNRASAACGRANPSTSDRNARPPGISRAGPHYVPGAETARCLRGSRGMPGDPAGQIAATSGDCERRRRFIGGPCARSRPSAATLLVAFPLVRFIRALSRV